MFKIGDRVIGLSNYAEIYNLKGTIIEIRGAQITVSFDKGQKFEGWGKNKSKWYVCDFNLRLIDRDIKKLYNELKQPYK